MRDEKAAAGHKSRVECVGDGSTAAKNKNALQKPFFGNKDLPGQTVEALKFQLADDITEELNELHAKGIDVNELLRAMLKRRKEEIAEEKERLSEEVDREEKFFAAADRPIKSRYIPRTQVSPATSHERALSGSEWLVAETNTVFFFSI